MFKKSIVSGMVAAAIVLICAKPSFAYLDPNAGSVVAQLVMGGVTGALFLVRLFWRKIRGRSSTVAPTEAPSNES